MGFHDLHAFNTTMLAKQCWRLMEQPDSLCVRVLHARYYLDGNLLNAKLKSGRLYTWQSVIHGMHDFKRGWIRRVGKGTKLIYGTMLGSLHAPQERYIPQKKVSF
jgi:hypothetical protein